MKWRAEITSAKCKLSTFYLKRGKNKRKTSQRHVSKAVKAAGGQGMLEGAERERGRTKFDNSHTPYLALALYTSGMITRTLFV
jgi:hypothetical protein